MEQTIRMGIVPLMKLKSRRLRTLGGFTAEDPWNANRPTEFNIDEYVMMPSPLKQAVDTKMGSYGHVIAIRSMHDDAEHFVPESLVELWRAGRIPAEHLPRLVHPLTPKLVKADYYLVLKDKWKNKMGWLVGGLLSAIGFAIVRFAPPEGLPVPALLPSLAFALALGAFGGAIGNLVPGMHRRRFKDQMNWALKEEAAIANAIARGDLRYCPQAGGLGSNFRFLLRLYFTIMGIMLPTLVVIGLAAYWMWG